MPYYDAKYPIFVPSTSPTSLGIGLGALSDDTTGANNLTIGPNAGSAITTGANNIEILTGNATDPASAATSNTLVISGGATAIISASSINSTPAVTIPGTLAVTGGFVGQIAGVGTTYGGVATGSFSQATSTGSTTLNSITGMSATLPIGTYIIDGYVACTNNSAGGIKLALNGGTAAVSSILADTWVYNSTTLTAEANSTTLSGPLVAATVAATAAFVSGSVVISTAGSITMQAAQNVANATALTITNGSYLTFTRIA
jgi:hypothetical protein